MRIYLIGSHSTGKTTLARHIATETGLPLMNEVIRQVMAEMEVGFDALRSNLDTVAEVQKEVFRRQIAAEKQAENGFVSDRAFDNLAYAARQSLILPKLVMDKEFEPYIEEIRKSIVFFVRPHKSLMANAVGREVVDWDEIIRIDGIIDYLIEWLRIPAIGIAELSLKSRVRTAMSVLRLVDK